MNSYLYQARVSGIQAYITATGKLKEIVGGSELIEQMCTHWFEEVLGTSFQRECLSLGAAGKIEYHFAKEDLCRQVVHKFPFLVAQRAPGLQVAQAVVVCQEEQPTRQEIEELEDKLEAQEQQIAARPLAGSMITLRASRTGGAVKATEEPLPAGEVRDSGQHSKIKASEGHGSLFAKILGEAYELYAKSEAIEQKHKGETAFAMEMDNLLRTETGWLAVIHADGNRLGQQIAMAMDKIAQSEPQRLLEFRRELSTRLENATVGAVQEAFFNVVKPQYEKEVVTELERRARYVKANKNASKRSISLPFRPIVLGGDDLTLIMRGDLAMPFTARFLASFELHTRSQFAPLAKRFDLPDLAKGLTASAGLAYIKYNYPFHYGLSLAESLCSHAKQVGRELGQHEYVPAGLAFHKVHSSFVEDYELVQSRELIIGPNHQQKIMLDGGPYFLQEQTGYTKLADLMRWVAMMNQPDAPKGNLREWLTTLATQPDKAAQNMERIKAISLPYVPKLALNEALQLVPEELRARNPGGVPSRRTHLHDVLRLSSIHQG
jgi:hypothetical protein